MRHPLEVFRERQQPPWRQIDLARKLGVGRATVSHWEGGTRRIGIDKLARVMAVTGLDMMVLRQDIGELLERNGDRQ